ncbi:MAG: methylmalonyl-CoA mutase [Candidatus Cloacimonetes bacterium 4572_55]|nr:MAG: methylmalonyl-CoA mutase [Candidatus Cloacimonetes bacterium 4572_55]
MNEKPYRSKQKIRIVTAASLFDGHDAAINVMRRVMQSSGAEIIHLGHNRSVKEIVTAAIQEDAQAIAVSSYQGGHIEFFKYMHDMLQEKNAGHIKIFGGGGGVITSDEIAELEQYGVAKIYSPEDGRRLGLQGMISHLLEISDFSTLDVSDARSCLTTDWDVSTGKITKKIQNRLHALLENMEPSDHVRLARLITWAESDVGHEVLHAARRINYRFPNRDQPIPVLGVTGTGGSGKSSVIDELIRRYLKNFSDHHIAILSVDPTKRKTGGALLGDRIRMNSTASPQVFQRSMATRRSNLALNAGIRDAIQIAKAAGFDLIVVESSGIGQGDTEIVDVSDLSVYIMTSSYGAATQLEKIDMIDYADVIVINKFERKGAEDAIRDVRKQYKRSHHIFTHNFDDDSLPIFGTIASQFNDFGMNGLYVYLANRLNEFRGVEVSADKKESHEHGRVSHKRDTIIPPGRAVTYMHDIAAAVRNYHLWANRQARTARQLYQLKGAARLMKGDCPESMQLLIDQRLDALDPYNLELIEKWRELKDAYRQREFVYQVRGKEIRTQLFTESLSRQRIPKVTLPKYNDWGDILRWQLLDNVPGRFPYTAGVFPFKRQGEDPKRMFAGEGPPERTNKRFHYLCLGEKAHRLSTAFDSVTLYGEDPNERSDIYGKIGNSGVSIATLDDMKKLYAGFDLICPTTSVSMTINGPAPIILAMFINTAIDQEIEKLLRAERPEALEKARFLESSLDENGVPYRALSNVKELIDPELYEKVKEETLRSVRGTVQADILKEDQAQNTCIFSTEFALRLMGDVQQYFIDHQVRNYYSVSISGYHIAEAGANPITQLALTLSNGFTYVEYYLSRGMDINDFAPSLSFFFSNGMDAEYTVIGRVARRIWSVAIKNKYGGNDRSQKLKYHIQTSGRSLHAQEIAFNDIRTTLQALMAFYDNCNSLHTNSYDEAVTTPTEESVRRAMAIQLIISKELGWATNENPLQGAFIIEELTDLVEEAVLQEFERIGERGGVLGAMETMYQRSKIQEESLYYESLKHSGQLPIVGVNAYLSPQSEGETQPAPELIRSSEEEKRRCLNNLNRFYQTHAKESNPALERLKEIVRSGQNVFEELLDTVRVCSLGQISHALYEVGGQYRRNM